MKRLTVYFDARCGLCVSMVGWLSGQKQLVPLLCVPKNEGVDELAVVADSGETWTGDSAWLMVLWALDGYRGSAYRLSRPLLLPLARQAFAAISRNRAGLSEWLGVATDAAIETRLREINVPACAK